RRRLCPPVYTSPGRRAASPLRLPKNRSDHAGETHPAAAGRHRPSARRTGLGSSGTTKNPGALSRGFQTTGMVGTVGSAEKSLQALDETLEFLFQTLLGLFKLLHPAAEETAVRGRSGSDGGRLTAAARRASAPLRGRRRGLAATAAALGAELAE